MKTDWTTDVKGTGQYAEVNGINLYYETHGAGRPLILLHGGLGSGETFGPVLPVLAERHQVITVDLQGHGRTADIDRPIDVGLMAGDIAALIDHLELASPDVVGYSLGGGMAYRIACTLSSQIAALATVEGAFYHFPGGCNPSRPIPVLEIHGQADQLASPEPHRSFDDGVGADADVRGQFGGGVDDRGRMDVGHDGVLAGGDVDDRCCT